MRPSNSAAVLLFLLTFLNLGSAYSTTITTVGSLSYDDSNPNNIITDSLNGYDWLRWDALSDYNYEQTLVATSSGGEYEQWSIAGINEAQKFANALVGANACTSTDITFTVCYNSRAKPFNNLLGDNFESYGDKAWFLSGRDTGQTVGYIETYSDKSVYKYNTGSNISESDDYSSTGIHAAQAVSWLLYRDSIPASLITTQLSTSIPAPSTLLLLFIGLVLITAKTSRHPF